MRFSIGDRVNVPKMGQNGTVQQTGSHGWVDVLLDSGTLHTTDCTHLTLISAAQNAAPQGAPVPGSLGDLFEKTWQRKEPEAPRACTCGGTKARTTCSSWCDSRPDATPPFKFGKDRLF